MKREKSKDIIGLLKHFLLKHRGILSTIILCGIAFVCFFKTIGPVNVNNLGGTHSWLSASTIKFVNNWLEKGAVNLKFTNYEDPDSVEFNTLEDREPYLSYPSGETFFVYIAARILGKEQISISFLHKFQIIMFGLEAILLGSFIYCLLKRSFKIKKEIMKVGISVLVSTLWLFLPVCAYYLANVYYSDQCVILWTFGLTLLEYLILTDEKQERKSLKILRALVLCFGILIDYYFVFLAFAFFVFEFLRVWALKKKGERKKELWSVVAWFGIPAILAVLIYFIQLNLTPGWLGIMKEKFSIRVVGANETLEWIYGTIYTNFMLAFSVGSEMINYLIGLICVTLIGCSVLLIKNKSIKHFVADSGALVISCNIIAIIAQIFFFKQHSAIHEFSMIKVGWIVAVLPLLLATFCYMLTTKKKDWWGGSNFDTKTFAVWFGLSYVLVFSVVGIPMSTIEYIKQREEAVDYSFETMIHEKTDYYDVVFSFTEDIPANPPHSLAVSKKRIYKINDLDEVKEKMSNIDEQAKIVLVIDKNEELESEKAKIVKCLNKQNEKRFENENYILLDIGEYENCNVPLK